MSHPIDRQFVREMAEAVAAKLPDGYAFIVLAAPFQNGGDNRLVYTSNARREDAINVLKEFLLRCGAQEDWMRHIT